MPKIEHAGHEIEVTPYVEDAVARLGIFKSEAIPYLAEGMAKYIDHGKTGYEMRRAGEELSDDEKEACGLSRGTRMARAYWDALTDEGRIDFVQPPEIVFQRIRSNLYREGKHRQLDESYARSRNETSSFYDEVTLDVVARRCCSAARKRAGKRISTPDRPRLPLPECDRDVCMCGYSLSKARATKRKKRLVEPVKVPPVRPVTVQPEPPAKPLPKRRVGFWGRLFGRS